jgi:SPP1 gp7 family putative phage head morphogenesis protein
MQRVKTLRPIEIDRTDFEKIEDMIAKIFKEQIYVPLIKELKPYISSTRLNSNEPTYALLRAIQDGQVSFYRGHFKGRFTARISKDLVRLGAKWDAKAVGYKIPLSKLGMDVRNAISVSGAKFNQVTEKIDKFLLTLKPEEIAQQLNVGRVLDATIWKLGMDLKETLKAISVQPDFTPDQLKKIHEDYNLNMRRYIQKWTEDEIIELRAKIAENVYSGRRYEGIAEEIMHSYGVSENKAKFLARQETSLYMAQIKKARYIDAGIKKYRWKCSHDGHTIRHDHKILDNTIQRYDSPPVTNLRSGARNNPGEDFNCYCMDEPIVEF